MNTKLISSIHVDYLINLGLRQFRFVPVKKSSIYYGAIAYEVKINSFTVATIDPHGVLADETPW